jgi:transcriptional regulator of heat shock response
MEERLGQILGLVVDQAIQTGEPVGSLSLVEQYGLKVSPATIRNYFAELEGDGYIMQPHTSSGRMPTEKGYREYVAGLLKTKHLTKKESAELEVAAEQGQEDNRRIKALAKAAADLAQNAVVVGIGSSDSYYKDWNRVVSMSDILDRLDEVLAKLRHVKFSEPTTLIGSECPFGAMCSTIVTSAPQGCLIGVLGPMRMDYAQGITLMKKIQQLLSV